MSRRRALRRGAAGLLAVLLAGAGLVALKRPLALAGEPLPGADRFTRWRGAVHVHTTASDGGGTPEEVVAAAEAAGLDFLVITDHNNADAKPLEGRRGRVRVLVGTEISTTAGHVVAVGVRAPTYRFSGDVDDAFADVQELGGVAFAAHPASPRSDFRWSGWTKPGPWGVEVLNGDSQWRAAGWGPLLRTAALYPLNPRHALLGSLTPPGEVLAQWDRVLAQRPAAAIAGVDAHSRLPVSRKRAVRFPSYESLFGLVSNHVLLPSPPSGGSAEEARAIADALGAGRSYVAVDAMAPGVGFAFLADAKGRVFTVGDTVPAVPPPTLRAGGRMPEGTRVRLVKDGRVVQEGVGTQALEDAAPGVYRVEAYVPGREVPWIVSNAIAVQSPEEAAARAARAAWPPEAEAPPARTVLETFDGPTAFLPEHDPSSAMPGPVVEPGAGTGGSAAGRLAFRLGAPTADRPFTWCALVERKERDLSGARGLVFAVKGDGVHRLWVQVRDANPASDEEGTEAWFASVKTSPGWRRVAVPFDRLRTLNRRSDGAVDPSKVRRLVFVIDHGAMAPGSTGTVWIDDLGVY